MTVVFQNSENIDIQEKLESHPGWHGHLAGLAAEKSLRGRAPYTYLLRTGEFPLNYYVSFVLPDLSIRHQPIVITVYENTWYCENAATIGPYFDESIGEMIHLVMHCKQDECTPLTHFEIR